MKHGGIFWQTVTEVPRNKEVLDSEDNGEKSTAVCQNWVWTQDRNIFDMVRVLGKENEARN